ncbi:hypothetical protein pipiens_013109 [Culex pipiens pipiens]|uniref:Uncharacterized protein n=1 Tax=Culex pipiens pipiens TaxID=38569 RepID=A0ABD1CZP9_CULPP
MFCRICLANCEIVEQFNLFTTRIDSRPLATVIEYCFEVEILEDEDNNVLCSTCKSDLEGAYRFITKLRNQSNTEIADLDERSVSLKADCSSPVYITEVEIETELPLESVEATSGSKNEQVDRVINISQEENKTPEPPDDGITSEFLLPETEQKDDSDKECFADLDVFYSSEDDSDSIEELNFSSDEDQREGKQPRKRLYYGVKSDSQPKRCCDCKEPLVSQEKVAEHSELYHQQHRVTNPKEFGDKRFECPVCFKRFETKKLYLQHQRKMYVDVLHPCSKCEEEFANLYVLKRHLKVDHKKKFLITELEELRSQSNICCGSFREKIRLAEHENSHRKIHQFLCSFCPATFAMKNSYEVHLKMHDGEERFNCEYCGKGFRKKSLLLTHLQTHSLDRPFKCHLCPNTFTRQNILDSHLLTHSDAGKPFKCLQCPASYIHQRDLRRHTREKHEGIRSFKCTKCPRAYIRQKLLLAHLRSHER